MRLGRNLRRIRKNLNLSQVDVGIRVGKDASYIGKIERGKRNPSMELVYKLAKELEVPVEELVK